MPVTSMSLCWEDDNFIQFWCLATLVQMVMALDGGRKVTIAVWLGVAYNTYNT